MSALIMVEADWPFGLRCTECFLLITEGMPYSESLVAMGEGAAVVEIVCVGCGLKGTDDV